jgi:hypothetical protein
MDAVSPYGEVHVHRTPRVRDNGGRAAVSQSPADEASGASRHRKKRYPPAATPFTCAPRLY